MSTHGAPVFAHAGFTPSDHGLHDDDPTGRLPDSAPDTAPTSPAEADEQQVRALAPSPNTLMMIGGGAAALALGGSVGYWLGRRPAPKPKAPRRLRHAASTAEAALDLAPVAMQLLANPVVRSVAMRMLLRQITRRIPS